VPFPDLASIVSRSRTRNLPARHIVTAVTGLKCEGGVLLYADRNIVQSDLTRTEGCKIYTRDLPSGSVALGNSTDDAIAGEDLAMRILDDLEKAKSPDIPKTIERVRRQMQNWSKGYRKNLPSLHSLIAFAHSGKAYLYLLQPPNAVLSKHAYSIGGGSRVIEPMLKGLAPEDEMFPVRVGLLHLAYMTRRAKEQEALVGGGAGWTGSDAVYIPFAGSAKKVDPVELQLAEELTSSLDECVSFTLNVMMGLHSPKELETMADAQRGLIVNYANSLTRNATFSALDDEQPR